MVYFVVADLTTLIIAFIVSLRARSWLGASLWNPEIWLQLQVLWIYLILTIAIWFLPVAAWLLLVSAWAKRSVTLWSIMPPLALVWAERMFFGTHWIGDALSDRLMTGYPATAFHDFTGSLAAAAQGTAGAPLDVLEIAGAGRLRRESFDVDRRRGRRRARRRRDQIARAQRRTVERRGAEGAH